MHNNLSGPRKVVYYREVLLLGEFVIRSVMYDHYVFQLYNAFTVTHVTLCHCQSSINPS